MPIGNFPWANGVPFNTPKPPSGGKGIATNKTTINGDLTITGGGVYLPSTFSIVAGLVNGTLDFHPRVYSTSLRVTALSVCLLATGVADYSVAVTVLVNGLVTELSAKATVATPRVTKTSPIITVPAYTPISLRVNQIGSYSGTYTLLLEQ